MLKVAIFITFFVVCSFIPTLFHLFFMKKRMEGISINLFGKIYVFYFSLFYFLASAFKLHIGYSWENLYESFWNAKGITYIHYAIPLLAGGILLCIFINFVKAQKINALIEYFLSVQFAAFLFTYFVVRDITNKTLCIGYLCGAIFFTISLIIRRKAPQENRDYKNNMLKLLLSLGLWIFMFSVFSPSEMYVSNADDFSISFPFFFSRLVIASIIVLIALVMLGTWLLIDAHVNVVFGIFSFALTMGYIQLMFLNGSMKSLDGEMQIWSSAHITGNALIWICLGIIFIILFMKKREWYFKLTKIIGIYLLLVQGVTLVVMLLTNPVWESKHQLALTNDGIMEVGSEKNIIVIVLDKFDGTIVDDIMADAPDFFSEISDFTYYENATSEHCPTELCIPFLITGTKWDKSSKDPYPSYAYTKASLYGKLIDNDYSTYIYTTASYLDSDLISNVKNMRDDVERKCNAYDLFCMMNIWSRYRYAPFAVKNYYIYYTYEISYITMGDSVYSINNDRIIYDKLIDEGLHVSDDANRYTFLHMNGAHPPFNITEELQYLRYEDRRAYEMGDKISQAKGSLKIVYEYLSQLKQLGKYDDSTIIITADHGYTDALSETGVLNGTSIPILFVKEPFDKNEGDIKVSNAPVCHEDVITTLELLLGYNNGKEKISDINIEDRKRTTSIEAKDTYYIFEIGQNSRNINDWKCIEYGKRMDVAE